MNIAIAERLSQQSHRHRLHSRDGVTVVTGICRKIFTLFAVCGCGAFGWKVSSYMCLALYLPRGFLTSLFLSESPKKNTPPAASQSTNPA